MIKNLSDSAGEEEAWAQCLDQDDLLAEEMATVSSIPAWRIPGTGEAVELPSMGLHRVGHD